MIDSETLDPVRNTIARKILLGRKASEPESPNPDTGWLPDNMQPNSAMFWRHFVALFLAMMVFGSDWTHGIASVVATNIGSLFWALLFSGLALLFATKKVRSKFWKVLIINCWIIAVIVILANIAERTGAM